MSEISKQEILSKIAAVRQVRTAATIVNNFNNEEIYKAILPDKINCFKTELEAISGQCFLYNNDIKLVEQLKSIIETKKITTLFCKDNKIIELLVKHNIPFTNQDADFENMEAGITSCEYLIARTGSIIISSDGDSGRKMSVFPPIHIVISTSSQILDYPEDAYLAVKNKYKNSLPSIITTITGPSRTADIEKTLVLGAHGPKELIVFLSNN